MTFLVLLNVALLLLLALFLVSERERAREFKSECDEHAARIARAADELEALRADLATRVEAQLNALRQECQRAITRVHAEAERVVGGA